MDSEEDFGEGEPRRDEGLGASSIGSERETGWMRELDVKYLIDLNSFDIVYSGF